MSKPRLLDLFSGGGGSARGYQQAGFYVVGVDVADQPNYAGDEFHRADAMTFPLEGFTALHASPPCQSYSAMSNCRPGLADEYERLIGEVRRKLKAAGVPYVIENVPGAPLAEQSDLFGNHGVTLCGQMFGLDLYRHRIFESNVPLVQPEHPAHTIPASPAGHWEPGTIMSISGHVSPIEEAKRAMGIGWMAREELAEAIPPAYTEHVGVQLMNALECAA